MLNDISYHDKLTQRYARFGVSLIYQSSSEGLECNKMLPVKINLAVLFNVRLELVIDKVVCIYNTKLLMCGL